MRQLVLKPLLEHALDWVRSDGPKLFGRDLPIAVALGQILCCS
jgi:hypothetical protein